MNDGKNGKSLLDKFVEEAAKHLKPVVEELVDKGYDEKDVEELLLDVMNVVSEDADNIARLLGAIEECGLGIDEVIEEVKELEEFGDARVLSCKAPNTILVVRMLHGRVEWILAKIARFGEIRAPSRLVLS